MLNGWMRQTGSTGHKSCILNAPSVSNKPPPNAFEHARFAIMRRLVKLARLFAVIDRERLAGAVVTVGNGAICQNGTRSCGLIFFRPRFVEAFTVLSSLLGVLVVLFFVLIPIWIVAKLLFSDNTA